MTKSTSASTSRLTSLVFLILLLHSAVGRSFLKTDKRRVEDTSKLFSHNQGKACGFYVWNVVSAGLHSLCRNLSKDCMYEGRGGRKFVLIPPGSFLQLLYPCDQYSPDACLWCGGNHEDHVALKWSKTHLYSPFDLMLDRVKKDATSMHVSKVWKDVPPDVKTVYGYHKRYVIDTNDAVKGANNKKQQRKKLKEVIVERYGENTHIVPKNVYGVRFALPRFHHLNGIREIVESRLRHLIEIQEIDNEAIDLKKHGEYSKRNAARSIHRLKRRGFQGTTWQ